MVINEGNRSTEQEVLVDASFEDDDNREQEALRVVPDWPDLVEETDSEVASDTDMVVILPFCYNIHFIKSKFFIL